MKMVRVMGGMALASLLILAGGGPLQAWEGDKAVELEYFFLPNSRLKAEDGGIQMHIARATAMAPIALGDTVFATLGIDYEGLFVEYRDLVFTYVDPGGKTFTQDDLPRALHALDLAVGLAVDLSDRLTIYGEFRPGAHSDFRDFGQEDIYYQGGAMLFYQFSEELTATLGAYYNDEFGQPELFPLLGVHWDIYDDFALDCLLPDNLEVFYSAASWLDVGLQAENEGHQFRLSENAPWENTVAKYNQILAGPFVDIIAGKHLIFRLEGGMAFQRQFEFRDDDSSEKLYNGAIRDNWYAGVSTALVF